MIESEIYKEQVSQKYMVGPVDFSQLGLYVQQAKNPGNEPGGSTV